MFEEVPEGFEPLINYEINERVQVGDLYYDEDDEEWLPVNRTMAGKFICDMRAPVARKAKKSVDSESSAVPSVRRIKRTRK